MEKALDASIKYNFYFLNLTRMHFLLYNYTHFPDLVCVVEMAAD